VQAGYESSSENVYPLVDGEYWEAAYVYRAALDARTTFTFAEIGSRVSQLGFRV